MFQPKPIYKGAFVDGVFSEDLNAQLHEEELRRIIAINRNADQRQKRMKALDGDGSDGRDVAQEVVLRFDARRKRR
jgi:hypothetical protein